MPQITGEFEVAMTPESLSATAAQSGLGRLSLDKRYRGALDASAQGEMLSVRAGVAGSAGYVALERVEGTLDGRQGSFYLQHSGSMARGTPSLSLAVVPDTGTGQLQGLQGAMAIRIEGGKHYYDFTYDIAEAP
ncbi:DUF3224 domain-containing protein [Janthinobacterium sp. BJB1]|uniref:DUF3224 domain-containing protein n=1 Tax=Janthinobacterium sp. GW458P TaxID=1981504 RepID=UPI000A32A3F2|nr:DUF3224 domain-containing protein [Janthinobacterium sp. GW458P]MBE3023735.1 DUF3224 domain-containing protein [Janthinobacterium sp. GW458P]PHV18611.1 DUF3224 domain-containing protein [Janthinobacterium sp. BJB303]PJC99426.1 DUF3224 domain-containing protein [Janthinobacterium sp. BJB1]